LSLGPALMLATDAPPIWRSDLLSRVGSVVHGFTGRQDQETALAGTLGLDPALPRKETLQNRQAVLDALGLAATTWISLRQVHGEAIVQVTREAGRSIEADGLWTRDQGAALAILTADCVPILFTNRTGTFVGAVHAGWRGTRAKIAAKMAERLSTQGVACADLLVALGPAIGPCCFAIGEDVAQSLAQAFPTSAEAIRFDKAQCQADLWALNRTALEEVGVPHTAIEEIRLCTHCDRRFFSHRRDHGVTGRQAGVICLRPPG
jgi:polyphenol oxidase